MENKKNTLENVKKAIAEYGDNPSAEKLKDILVVSAVLSPVDRAEIVMRLSEFKDEHGMSKAELNKEISRLMNEATKTDADEPLETYRGRSVIPLFEMEYDDIGNATRRVMRFRDEVSDDAFRYIKNGDAFVIRGGKLGFIKNTGLGIYGWEEAGNHHITSYIGRKAVFENISDDPKILINAPDWVATDILFGQDFSDLPALELIVSHPYVHDGKIVDTIGFHKKSGYYRPENTHIDPVVPDNSEQAINVIRDMFCDFPFEKGSDFENALAVPLTMLLRSTFPPAEMVPLCAINAASPGTGKSALAKLLFSMLLPSTPVSTSLSDNREELRKSLITQLKEGKNYAIFDNLDNEKPLDSGVLASFISEPVHSDRLLGGNSSGTFPNLMVPVYTGNNIQASSELVDRGFLINLLSPPERSADRTFKHEQLFAYARKRRPHAIGALCFLIQKWLDAGMPMSEHRHRMRYWAKCIGGVLQANGLGEHFLENMMKFRRQTDSESPQWAKAFAAIYDEKEGDDWTVSDVFTIISYKKSYYHQGTHYPEVGQNLLGGLYRDAQSDQGRTVKVGNLMKSRIGQTLGGYKLDEAPSKGNRKRYRIIKINDEK